MVLPEKSAFQATNTVVHADYIMIIELNIVQNKKVYLSFWHSQEIIHKTCTKNLGSKIKKKRKEKSRICSQKYFSITVLIIYLI